MVDCEQFASISIKEALKGIKCKMIIKGYRGWIVRLYISKYLIRFACWISGLNIKIEDSND